MRQVCTSALPNAAQQHTGPQSFPITPFEHYMLADCHAGYSMCPALKLVFSGCFDHDRLREAFRATLSRHVMFQVRLQGSIHERTATLAWTFKPGLPLLEFRSTDPLSEMTPIDLYTECGLRMWNVEQDDYTDMYLQFHHAVSDLGGVIGFVRDLLSAYADPTAAAKRTGDERLNSQQRLLRRNTFKTSLPSFVPCVLKDLTRAVQFHTGQAEVIRPSEGLALGANRRFSLACRSTVFEPDDVAAILNSAKRRRVTVNDLLLQGVFGSIARWNDTGGAGVQGRIRIGVPVSLRDTMPLAANVMGMVFLDRHRSDCLRATSLLKSINQEMANVKSWQMGKSLLRYLAMRGQIRGGINRLVGSRKCVCTGIFSNMGRLFPDLNGDLLCTEGAVLESLQVFPAVRPSTHAVAAASTYGGRMLLDMGYDASVLSTLDASLLVQSVKRQVLDFV